MDYDVIIIGGGAAGLAAAVTAGEACKGLKIAVIERGARMGRKIAVTGNGRCNITNRNLSLSRFHGEDVGFAKYALERINLEYTLDFWNRLGVPVRFDAQGRGYPYSLQAASVLDALRFRATELGVGFIMPQDVSAVKKGFRVLCGDKSYTCKKVLVAAGGYAAPKLGSDGSGCRLLKSLGHSTTRILPAIVQLKTETSIVRQLKGIKVDGIASVMVDGKIRRTEEGEILFTDYGLSGPPVMAFSRIASENIGRKKVEVSLCLMPDFSEEKLAEIISERKKSFASRELLEFFTGFMNKRLGQVVLKTCGKRLTDLSGSLSEQDILNIAAKISDFRFEVIETGGFANAQTTAGGIKTSEFCGETMESRICRGLYAAGEVLDIDGDCGGYNLQWAWSSGILAGLSLAGATADGEG